jgi:uncharacterized membrane protein
MITAHKINPGITAYYFAMVILLIVLGMYGEQAIEWVLMKLYEFFIQRTPIAL